MTYDFDAILVGAGPTGLTLALLLARRGHQVALLERWPQPYPQPRAIGLNHEALRVLHQAGADHRLEQVLDWTRDLVEAQYLTADNEVLVRMPFRERAESGWPEMQAFNQPDVEAYLEELINESPRIRVMRNVVVSGLERSSEGVVVQYRAGAGQSAPQPEAPLQRLTARFVVGCDGANSFIASQLKLPRTDLGFSSDWLVADIRPRTPRKWTPYLAQVLDPGRPTTVAPAGPGRRRLEFMLMPGETRESMATAEAAWKLLARWQVTPENAELVRSVVYTFRGSWANQWRDGRAILAGDAAHLTPPFLGQGFNACLRDAANLAMHLDLVLRNLAPLELLDRYTEERLPHVQTMIEIAVHLGRQICITDPDQARARDAGLRAMRDSGQTVGVASLPIRSGMLSAGDALAGTLSHQGRVEHAGRTGNFDDVCANGCFVLIGTDADPAAHLSPQARQLWQQIGGASFHIGAGSAWHDADGEYQRWLGDQHLRVVLVRPDYYVFGAGPAAQDADRLVLELGRQLGLVAAAR